MNLALVFFISNSKVSDRKLRELWWKDECLKLTRSQIEPYVGVLASSVSFELGSSLRASKFHEFHLHIRLSTSDCRSDRFRRRDLHRRRGHLRMLDFHAFRSPHVVEMKMEGFCEVPDCV